QIQTDAIAKARRGDYTLLDAMELDARLKEPDVICGYRIGGRLRLLGMGADADTACHECDGSGTCACPEVDCIDGCVDCDNCADDPDGLVLHEACGGKGCD